MLEQILGCTEGCYGDNERAEREPLMEWQSYPEKCTVSIATKRTACSHVLGLCSTFNCQMSFTKQAGQKYNKSHEQEGEE